MGSSKLVLSLPLPVCTVLFPPTPPSRNHTFCGPVPQSQQEFLFPEVWWRGWATGHPTGWQNRGSHRELCGVSPRRCSRGLFNFMLLVITRKWSRSPSSCRRENANARFQQGSVSKRRLSLQLALCITSWVLITQLLNVGISTTPRG